MRQYRVLIVDDEPFVVDWIADLLEHDDDPNAEYDICRAYGVDEALRWLSRARIDLMVTDIQMPGVSGLELAENVRERWPACQVAFLTAYARFDYAYKAVNLGSAGYILKSEDDAKILKKLRAAIRLVGAEADAAPQAAPAAECAALRRFLAHETDETALLRSLGWKDRHSLCLLAVTGEVDGQYLNEAHRAVSYVCGDYVWTAYDDGFYFLLSGGARENVPTRLKNMLEWAQDSAGCAASCLISPVIDASELAGAAAKCAQLRGERRSLSYIYCYALNENERSGDNALVRFIQRYIETHISGDVSLVRLSEATGYNASYISRLYSEVTGERLSRFISRRRMDYIRTLMTREAGTLEEIAVQAGFSSRTYFNHFVRQNAGVQPSELFRQLRGK